MFLFIVFLLAGIFLWGFRVGKKDKKLPEDQIVPRPTSTWKPIPCQVCKQEIPVLLHQIIDHQEGKHR